MKQYSFLLEGPGGAGIDAAIADNYVKKAGIGAGLGAIGGGLYHYFKDDDDLNELKKRDPEAYKKERKRRLLKRIGAGAGVGLAGGVGYGGYQHHKTNQWIRDTNARHEEFARQAQQEMDDFRRRSQQDMDDFRSRTQQDMDDFRRKYGFDL